jgi:hypothetical protein
MDIALSKEERAFAEEMRTFFRTQIPAEIRERGARGEHVGRDAYVTTQQILNQHGLAVPHWPLAWGGKDWTPIQRHLYNDEMLMANVPPPLAFNVHMVGPVIAEFGNEEQKHRFLPPTANLDTWWCQGFSEPNAGSDLASLKTSAVRDGDHYVVNGQKTWTTLAQYADWIFCLVRTDPAAKKQRGISFLLIDMSSPGVTVRPIQLIDGGYEVNEVFFDNVLVPADQLVGQENAGWDYAKFLLGNERTNVVAVGQTKARVLRIKRLAAQTAANGRCSVPGSPDSRSSWPPSRCPCSASWTPKAGSVPASLIRCRPCSSSRAPSSSNRPPNCSSTSSAPPAPPIAARATSPMVSRRSRKERWKPCPPTSTGVRPRSTAAPTRCSERSSPRPSWDSDPFGGDRRATSAHRRAAHARRDGEEPARQAL